LRRLVFDPRRKVAKLRNDSVVRVGWGASGL
jgi:hypothetical protein